MHTKVYYNWPRYFRGHFKNMNFPYLLLCELFFNRSLNVIHFCSTRPADSEYLSLAVNIVRVVSEKKNIKVGPNFTNFGSWPHDAPRVSPLVRRSLPSGSCIPSLIKIGRELSETLSKKVDDRQTDRQTDTGRIAISIAHAILLLRCDKSMDGSNQLTKEIFRFSGIRNLSARICH